MSIRIVHKGKFSRTMQFFKHLLRLDYSPILEEYGRRGVEALQAATPVDTGKTAESWTYAVNKQFGRGRSGRTTLEWSNTNKAKNGQSIALLIQYGHMTRNGAYVPPYDYINPALANIQEAAANDVWKEVIK